MIKKRVNCMAFFLLFPIASAAFDENDFAINPHECLSIIAKILSNSPNVFLINTDWHFDVPTIRYRGLNEFVSQMAIKQIRGDYVINLIDQTTSDQFNATVLNTRSRFIVLLSDAFERDEVFARFARLHIYDVFAVKDGKIFTYRNENVNVPQIESSLIADCSGNDPLPSDDPFAQKLPRLWRNTTVRIGWIRLPPYTICYYDCPHPGIEFDLLRILESKLLFRISEEGLLYPEWGTKTNGKLTQALEGLYEGKFDVGVGLFHYHEWYSSDFDTSFAYIQDALTWSVPRAKPISHTEKLVSMFDFATWLSIFVSILIVTVGNFAIAHVSAASDAPSTTIYHCFSNSLLVLLLSGPYGIPTSRAGRTLFLSWGLYCVILNTILQGKLINNLNHQILGKQVTNLDEVMAHGLKFAVHPEIGESYANGGTAIDKYVAQNYVPCIFHEDCSERVLNGPYAMASLRSTIETSERFVPLIYAFKTNIRVDLASIYSAKGYPLSPQIDRYILQLSSAGIVKHLVTSAKARSSSSNLKNLQHAESRRITFGNLSAIFTLLFIGYATGFVAFCVELVYAPAKDRIFRFQANNFDSQTR